MMVKKSLLLITLACFVMGGTLHAAPPEGPGWVPLFNGKDLAGWKGSEAAMEVWSVEDGVIDCKPRLDIKGDKDLWTAAEYEDFTLYAEWRIKKTKGAFDMPTILPDGTEKKDADGKFIVTPMPNADSGIYLRGSSKSQVNIWCWPVGSGEVYGYRTDKSMPAEVRAGVTPSQKADKPVGEWNTFKITVQGDRLTVVLNGMTVIDNAQLPGIPEKGPIALQHHGGFDPRRDYWSTASSLVQFRDLYIKLLPQEK